MKLLGAIRKIAIWPMLLVSLVTSSYLSPDNEENLPAWVAVVMILLELVTLALIGLVA
ncbi:MAG: hypothetical protein JWP13_770, partial [Candidatus Saccharibacteria bacterium]|nr:hypothetical protein [Candidatus Saccharibacteria bacterium]